MAALEQIITPAAFIENVWAAVEAEARTRRIAGYRTVLATPATALIDPDWCDDNPDIQALVAEAAYARTHAALADLVPAEAEGMQARARGCVARLRAGIGRLSDAERSWVQLAQWAEYDYAPAWCPVMERREFRPWGEGMALFVATSCAARLSWDVARPDLVADLLTRLRDCAARVPRPQYPMPLAEFHSWGEAGFLLPQLTAFPEPSGAEWLAALRTWPALRELAAQRDDHQPWDELHADGFFLHPHHGWLSGGLGTRAQALFLARRAVAREAVMRTQLSVGPDAWAAREGWRHRPESPPMLPAGGATPYACASLDALSARLESVLSRPGEFGVPAGLIERTEDPARRAEIHIPVTAALFEQIEARHVGADYDLGLWAEEALDDDYDEEVVFLARRLVHADPVHGTRVVALVWDTREPGSAWSLDPAAEPDPEHLAARLTAAGRSCRVHTNIDGAQAPLRWFGRVRETPTGPTVNLIGSLCAHGRWTRFTHAESWLIAASHCVRCGQEMMRVPAYRLTPAPEFLDRVTEEDMLAYARHLAVIGGEDPALVPTSLAALRGRDGVVPRQPRSTRAPHARGSLRTQLARRPG